MKKQSNDQLEKWGNRMAIAVGLGFVTLVLVGIAKIISVIIGL